MKPLIKLFFWVCGLIILIILIRNPFTDSESMWKTFPLPLSGQTIVIDPGHGGADGGAVGKDNTTEKDIALRVAKVTKDYLQEAGAVVYLTREEDHDLAEEDVRGLSRRKAQDIRNRLKFIHDKEADLFKIGRASCRERVLISMIVVVLNEIRINSVQLREY